MATGAKLARLTVRGGLMGTRPMPAIEPWVGPPTTRRRLVLVMLLASLVVLVTAALVVALALSGGA